jgi:hypothetical protein
MRFNLITQSAGTSTGKSRAIPLSLTLRPSCGIPGEYVYPTDSNKLLRMLELGTDLPSAVLRRFMGDIYESPKARLLGVELNDDLLNVIGYFVD